ncbi:hypothetical protein CH273_10045 [Rhodococcus sp. 05-339-2]|nr:hypothetical protein CH273_10045 [Rhodococcus sp. 05-339-2]
MVDCSIRAFNEMSAQNALKVIGRLSRLALEHSYAHVAQTLYRSDSDIIESFEQLWDRHSGKTLLIILDEVDYITPDSPTSGHWKSEFSEFWRELRALVQESHRHDLTISLLVSGVSSRSFRVAEIAEVENPVLHFVPENYLSPFPDGAADSMIKTLGNRCGLQFSKKSRDQIATAAAGLPFWIRMLGSFIHRSVDIDSRPLQLEDDLVSELCIEFASHEGAEIAKLALRNLQRTDEPMYDLLLEIGNGNPVDTIAAAPLVKYGLIKRSGHDLLIESIIVQNAIAAARHSPAEIDKTFDREVPRSRRSLDLDENEWAEELAAINKRRNLLERQIREFIRIALKMRPDSTKQWHEHVIAALPQPRRDQCGALAPETLMSKLYWIELSSIIRREWQTFGPFLGDKRRTETAFELLNERPDAHAKIVDLADIALQRKELTWLEERVSG